jgi:hypothetical protein
MGVWLPHVATLDPLGSGLVEVRPEHPAHMGTWRCWTYMSTGGGSGDHDPSCQARVVRLVTQKVRARHPNRRYLCLYVPTGNLLQYSNRQY